MIQPKRFIALYELYLTVEAQVNEGKQRRLESQVNRAKTKGRIKRGR